MYLAVLTLLLAQLRDVPVAGFIAFAPRLLRFSACLRCWRRFLQLRDIIVDNVCMPAQWLLLSWGELVLIALLALLPAAASYTASLSLLSGC